MPRKDKKFHYIYKTTNFINEKYYIGMHSTDNLVDGYIGSGKRLWFSIKKYGEENFKCEILEIFPNRKKLKEREIELINEDLLKDEKCMNLVYGGSGGYISPEGCKKGGTNALKKNWQNNDFREKQIKKASEQAKKFWTDGRFVYRDNWTGKNHTIETIEKMKGHDRQVGEKNSQFGSCWITNEIENKKIKKNDTLPNGWKLGRILK